MNTFQVSRSQETSEAKGSILIVDDTPANLRLLASVLSKQGYIVRPIRDSRMVFSSACSAQPDLILLDIKMPYLSGYQVCEQLKADERTCDIPIIFISALNEVFDKVKAFSVGGVDYVSKPFHLEEVLARIETHLALRRLQKRLKSKNEQLEDTLQTLQTTQKQLIEAKEKAEMASQAKSEFLSNMSHELRTPLNGVLGYAQILRRGHNLTSTQKKGVEIIYHSGHHLLTLINDILDLSKIEARKMKLHPKPINLPNLLKDVHGIIRMRAEEKNVLFVCHIDDTLPIGIQADEIRLRQVLINLLGNAVKFTPHGKVTLRVRELACSSLLSRQANHAKLRFEVIDTGIGISKQELEKIFSPFEQAGEGKQQAQGTGLGLTITRQLLSLMGGEIKVESELGKGSRFWFDLTLPLAVVEPTEVKQISQQIIGYQGATCAILVIDDGLEHRLLLSNMLSPLGFDVLLAKNEQEGMALASQKQPDLILMGLMMPMTNGLESVKKIRQTREIQHIPIIAISASAFDIDQKKSQLAGCNAFVPKPIDEKKLLATISALLGLTWLYEEHHEEAVHQQTNESHNLIAPPIKELKQLHELASLGRISILRQYLTDLEQLDSQYAPFIHKVRQLAQRFEDDQILTLINKYI